MIVGPSGVGKSSLLQILLGYQENYQGQVLVSADNDLFDLHQIDKDSWRTLISWMPQEPHFPVATVIDCVQCANPNLDSNELIKQLQNVGIELSELPSGGDTQMGTINEALSIGQKRKIALTRALIKPAQLLILDEPTAVLTPQETDELLNIMRTLSAKGTSIIFITHKLREVKAVADKITIIRLGKVVGMASPSSTQGELASMMVGREVHLSVDRAPLKKGDVVLSVDQISVRDDRGQLAVNDLSLELHAGEVLAIAGVQGNGQTELAEAIVGLRKLEKGSGKIVYKGKSVESLSVRERLEDFLSYVPEDRKKDGLVSEFNIEENLMLNQSYEDDRGAKFVRRGLLDQAALKSEAEQAIERFDIRTQGSKSLAGKLSGGNQQKVVIGKWLTRNCDILIFDEPTRGIDVGAKDEIYKLLTKLAEEGKSIIMISSELPEILRMSDRVAVMCNGRLTGIIDNKDANQEVIIEYATKFSDELPAVH